ncbi:hypothetical protein FNW02_00145 [Komarekiella sp. 'clone 1']|uniref:Uncharacterized protein n=1 Tax=Komarekiella delphini-convector SJRDD-AB1 TaxID=2593771 RepID=A0AA40VP64_9NOST|nr:hypothetical protein [Komarekiella delphini-convector]MBD6614327.1 hypothetical protein [Komarekiella delphini-convector SJRDD-AB1]
MTKSRLDQIATNQGISLFEVGVRFERFALATIRPGNPIASNGRKFESRLRYNKVRILNVQPDGVVPLPVVTTFAPFFREFADAIFYEAKAVKGTLLPPSYQDSQILGFLDVLGKNPARAAGENPAIVFMTTSDVRKISRKTITEATSRDIGVWHSIACEVAPLSGNLQLGQTALINPGVYLRNFRFPRGYGGPGTPGKI